MTKSVIPLKRKAGAKSQQSPDPRARLSPDPIPVACPVVSDDVQFKLQISNLKFQQFSAMILLFLYQNIVTVITRFATNVHEYFHDTTRNDPDPATVELRLRPRPRSNTIQHDEFKRFKLVVALSWRFPNHQDSSRITMVLLGLAPMSLRCYYDSCRCITT